MQTIILSSNAGEAQDVKRTFEEMKLIKAALSKNDCFKRRGISYGIDNDREKGASLMLFVESDESYKRLAVEIFNRETFKDVAKEFGGFTVYIQPNGPVAALTGKPVESRINFS